MISILSDISIEHIVLNFSKLNFNDLLNISKEYGFYYSELVKMSQEYEKIFYIRRQVDDMFDIEYIAYQGYKLGDEIYNYYHKYDEVYKFEGVKISNEEYYKLVYETKELSNIQNIESKKINIDDIIFVNSNDKSSSTFEMFYNIDLSKVIKTKVFVDVNTKDVVAYINENNQLEFMPIYMTFDNKISMELNKKIKDYYMIVDKMNNLL